MASLQPKLLFFEKMIGFLFLALLSCVFADTNYFDVKGILKCKGEPYAGATVLAVDKDPGFDDEIGHMDTSKDGSFVINGSASDPVGTIDVKLKIYHKCDKKCLHEVKYDIPEYFYGTKEKRKYVDFGVTDLAILPPCQEQKCIEDLWKNVKKTVSIGK